MHRPPDPGDGKGCPATGTLPSSLQADLDADKDKDTSGVCADDWGAVNLPRVTAKDGGA
jgi:hypothetical protein